MAAEERRLGERWPWDEERARLVTILEATTDFVGTTDREGRATYINRAGRRMLGIGETEDVTATLVLDLVPGWAGEIISRDGIPTAFREGVWAGETALLARDGREIPVSQLIIAHKNAAGQVAFLSTIARDITERKATEGALRESERRYRDLVENAKDIIYTHDLAGRYTSLNRAGEEITGYTREEVLNLRLSDILVPEELEKARQRIRDKLAGLDKTVYDLEITAKDGRKVALEVSSWLIYQNGQPVAVQGIARDVTDRKQLEEQLRQAQKMEAVGRLAGGVAHDFNNMLTAIMGQSDLLLMRLRPGDPLRQKVEEIKKAGERAAALTRQLLAFSRKQMLQPRVLDLNLIVEEMDRMLRRMIGEDVELVTVLEPHLGEIKADPSQIEQVVMNLVVNARDAMPDGGRLTIRTANAELDRKAARKYPYVQPGAYVMLVVSDTGQGMDEETRKHIFEPFFTTKEVGKGTGLGLSTVYGIVKQSGGYIWVESEVGHGSTFRIYLPRIKEKASADEANMRPDLWQGTETVLLVEDDQMVRGLACEVLGMSGYSVLEAASVEEGISIGTRHEGRVDLLVTDVVMPQMSGRDLARRLASVHPEMRVLYMSGYTGHAIMHRGVLDGGVDFIQKPFTPDDLTRKVREVLDANREIGDRG